MTNSKWVSVAKIHDDIQAEVLRGLLEAQDIPVVLSKEGAGRAIGLTVGSLGEVDILVPESYQSEARETLASYERGEFEADDSGDPGE